MNIKLQVVKKFRDKHTKEVYLPGRVIDVTKKRAAEIERNLGAGYVTQDFEVTPDAPPETEPEVTPDDADTTPESAAVHQDQA